MISIVWSPEKGFVEEERFIHETTHGIRNLEPQADPYLLNVISADRGDYFLRSSRYQRVHGG